MSGKSGGGGGGGMSLVGLILLASLAIWFISDYESFTSVLFTFIDQMVKLVGDVGQYLTNLSS